jgi:drug/metabolite transporter (DMT)-like permease
VPEKLRRSYLIGFTLTFLGAILFSTKAIFVKLAFAATAIDALSLLMLRMVFAVPFYLAIGLFASSRKENVFFTRKQWFYVILLGLLGYYLSSLFDFIGLQYVSAALERLILFLYPTFAVLLNAAIFKQKITSGQKLALLLTYIGIGIAYYGEMKIDTTNPNFFVGTFFIFLCALTFAFYLVGTGRIIGETGATKFTSYAMLSAAAGVILHYHVIKGFSYDITSEMAVYGLAIAIFATVIPTFMISHGIKTIGSNNVAIVSSLGPVSTIIQANLILHEEVHTGQLIGTVLVIVGVLLIGWKTSRPHE